MRTSDKLRRATLAYQGTLPEWTVEDMYLIALTPEELGGGLDPGDIRQALRVTCPSCGARTIVGRLWLRSRAEFVGRSCTYCFRTARLPDSRLPPGTTMRRAVP